MEIAGTVLMMSEDSSALSVQASRVLDDLGASWTLVLKRRETYLLQEEVANAKRQHLQPDKKSRLFYVGSQTEGATIPGLDSDLDILLCNYDVNVMSGWNDWRNGKENRLVVFDVGTPPRHCLFQMVRDDAPLPIGQLDCLPTELRKYCLLDNKGRVLLKNEFLDDECERLYESVGRSLNKSGPAKGWSCGNLSKRVDVVPAYPCKYWSNNNEDWVTKPRTGQWPSAKVLREAQEQDCFVIPCGHPESDTTGVEWRLASNLLERLLFFHMNITHIKTCVLLKMIRKYILGSLCKNGLSSFHMKTALFFTIERTPLELWQEHNLVMCVQSSLVTLHRFLKLQVCPHYTLPGFKIIPGINLFDGKLNRAQLLRLQARVEMMIKGQMLNDLFEITVVDFGRRLKSVCQKGNYKSGAFPSRVDIHKTMLQTFEQMKVKCRS